MKTALKLVPRPSAAFRLRDPEMQGIEIRGDRIRITFWWQGQRCRETLKLAPTPPNLKYAQRLRKQILDKIDAGVFRYGDIFPDSPRARRAGIVPAKSRLFSEFAEQWLRTKKNVSAASIKDYRSSLDRFWLPTLGAVRAEDLVQSMIKEAIATIAWRSPKHKNNALVSLRGVLEAMYGDEATRRNLSTFVDNDQLQKPEPNPLTTDQIADVLDYIKANFDDEVHNLFEIGFFTGLRPGELIALYWTDVSFELGTLTVQRSWGHDKDEEDYAYRRDRTKTSKVRHVELSARAIAALKRQKQLTGEHKEIFRNRENRLPYASSKHLYLRVWVPTLKATNISPRRMYQMRHTYATMNLMAGANPVWIAEQLGHSDARLVFTTYGKWIKGADKLHQKKLLDDWLAIGTAPSVPQSPEGKGTD